MLFMGMMISGPREEEGFIQASCFVNSLSTQEKSQDL
uniref:Uncharacterized protein n=1 Tax=Anguilla anguilla TaxID=7936 RepID=A0A0E9V8Z7_ANGAN